MSRKSVLITGCSKGGIGHSLALEWHSRGYRVFATARRLEVMSDLQEAGIECLKMDVTDTTSLKKIKEEVEQRTGGTLNVLVNNAGLGIFLTCRADRFRIHNASVRYWHWSRQEHTWCQRLGRRPHNPNLLVSRHRSTRDNRYHRIDSRCHAIRFWRYMPPSAPLMQARTIPPKPQFNLSPTLSASKCSLSTSKFSIFVQAA